MGRKNSILLGFLLLLITTTALGMLDLMPRSYTWTFYTVACLIRFGQGYADCLISTTQYSVVNQVYSDAKAQYISYLEASSGLGMIVGPPLGSLIYGFAGYAWSFYAFSIMILLNFLGCAFCMPNKLNATHQLPSQSQKPAQAGQLSVLTGTATYNNEAVLRLEKRREAQRKKRAADREGLLIKHAEDSDQVIPRSGGKRRTSIQDRETELLQGCNLLTKDEVGFMLLLKNKKVTWAYLQSVISMYCVCFFGSFLAIHFGERFDVPDEDMGYCFLLASGPYLLSCIIFPILLKKTPRKLQAVICFFASAVSIGFMGPTKLFGLPDRLAIILVGMFFLGFVQALSFIPVLPEVVDQVTIEYKIVEGTDEDTEGLLHDTIAALYNLWYSAASLLSPIIGGFLFDQFHYHATMNISMAAIFIAAILYSVFNCGTKVYDTTRAEMKELARLKEIKTKLDQHKEGQVSESDADSPAPRLDEVDLNEEEQTVDEKVPDYGINN